MAELNNLAVIILNYNSYSLTITAVDNLVKLYSNLKIVIIDNASPGDDAKKLEDEYQCVKNIHVLLNKENKGYAQGNNIGIEYVRRKLPDVDTILIMNPDVYFDNAEVLTRMNQTLQNDSSLGALTVRTNFNGIVREPNECAWQFMAKSWMMFGGTILGKKILKPGYYNEFSENSNGVAFVDVVQGCFFMIRLECLNKAGDFDPNTFLYSEESILAKKLLKSGYVNGVIPSLLICHNHQTKDKQLKSKTNKRFDMACYYNSRKYYIENYSDTSRLFKTISKFFLDIDHIIKRIFLKFKK